MNIVQGIHEEMRIDLILQILEFCAELYVRARTIGKPVILPDDEMDQMVERFKIAGY